MFIVLKRSWFTSSIRIKPPKVNELTKWNRIKSNAYINDSIYFYPFSYITQTHTHCIYFSYMQHKWWCIYQNYINIIERWTTNSLALPGLANAKILSITSSILSIKCYRAFCARNGFLQIFFLLCNRFFVFSVSMFSRYDDDERKTISVNCMFLLSTYISWMLVFV